tara:strand:- start:369 stop:614 length:246 start_codon:yes stop_codon:yes gene_type:complete
MSKKKLDEGFLKNLAKNVAVYLAVNAVKNKKPKSAIKDPSLQAMYKDLDKYMDRIEKEAEKRIAKKSPEEQKELARIMKML